MWYEFFKIFGSTLLGIALLSWFQRRAKKQSDYYILKMYGLIDPLLLGPFEFNVCQEKLEAYREDPEQSENSFNVIIVSKGAELDI
jgi:hypothetical protein